MAQADNCDTGTCAPSSGPTGPEDPLDWHTFPLPLAPNAFPTALSPTIVIEFCNRCRWQHRATWIQTELFVTFEDKPSDQQSGGKYSVPHGLKSIQLIPCNAPETAGRFRIWLYSEADTDSLAADTSSTPSSPHGIAATQGNSQVVLLWDRKIRQGFPELKDIKQIIRDQIAPKQSLGHSDKKAH